MSLADTVAYASVSQWDVAEAYAKASFDHLLKCVALDANASPLADPSSFEPSSSHRVCTAYDLYSRYRGVRIGLPEVDAGFQGGVPSGFVVELCGPPATGKSRLASLIVGHHAAAEAQRQLEHSHHHHEEDHLYHSSSHKQPQPEHSPSVIYLQCDYHSRHSVSAISDAIRYHSTLLWEKASAHSYGGVDEDFASAEAIAAIALNSVCMCNVAEALDGSNVPDAVAEDPLRAVIQLLQTQLCGSSNITTPAAASGHNDTTRIVVIDSVPSLLRRAFSGHPSEAAARHDALSHFLQHIKDIAVLFNVVVILTNHVVFDSAGLARNDTEAEEEQNPYWLMCDRFESSLRGALGTPFYHAVNIRILLYCPPDQEKKDNDLSPNTFTRAVYLHVAKSPIGPSNTFVVAGLLNPLQCYERVNTSEGSIRLKPSVRVTTLLQ